MTICIQIPAFRSQFLGQAVESVFRQTSPDWRLQVLLDGPDRRERTSILQILGRLEQDRRLQVFEQANRGTGRARLKLFSMTQDPYILPLDDDDLLLPTAVEKCSTAFAAHADATMVRAKRVVSDTIPSTFEEIDGLLPAIIKAQERELRFQGFHRRLKFGWPVKVNVEQLYCMRRTALQTVNVDVYEDLGFVGENIDWCLKLEELGPVIWLDDVLYVKRKHPANQLDRINAAGRTQLKG